MNENVSKIISLILTVIPLAMGVAVIALLILKQLTPEAGLILLALGMVCGAMEQLRQGKKS